MPALQTPVIVIIVGVVSLTVLGCVAMLTGHDGTLLTLIVGVIAAAIGVPIGAYYQRRGKLWS